MKKLYLAFSYLFFNPVLVSKRWKAVPHYLRNWQLYKAQSKKENGFPVSVKNIYVTTADKFMPAGHMGGHYFLQDLWVARYLAAKGIKHVTDVGSRIDGFIAHMLCFATVEYVDFRPPDNTLPGLTFKQGDIKALPYQTESLDVLTCLHVIEHIGLGRYGDPIDVKGHEKAAAELSRIVKKDGMLILSTPVGKQRLEFDAHRVFDPQTILDIFPEMKLEAFHLIDDKAKDVKENASLESARSCSYGCGIFVFRKAFA